VSKALGIIVGNRGFFPGELCKDGRRAMVEAVERQGMEPVVLPEEHGVYGSCLTRKDALACAELFQERQQDIIGIIVTLPNFGDEKAVAEALRHSGLQVPVLVHAFPDALDKMDIGHRRDSFCGKLSVCNNLRQYGIPFSLTTDHTSDPNGDVFRADMRKFTAVCRVVDGLKHIRIGVVGPRPSDFNTVRFSERIFERHGISVESVGLVDILQIIDGLADDDTRIYETQEEIRQYMDVSGVPPEAMVKLAKLQIALDQWVRENQYDAVAIQCWSSLQTSLGVNPCTVMSMLSQSLIPASCEADAAGAVSMLALQLAAQQPSGLVDWNNNYGDDPNKAVVFHCGNYAKSLYKQSCIAYADILGSSLGMERTYGAIAGQIKPGPITFARVSTDDMHGTIRAYTAEGIVTEDVIESFGSWGVVEVPALQKMMGEISRLGFEHHVAVNLSHVGDVLAEAFGTYFGWEMHDFRPNR